MGNYLFRELQKAWIWYKKIVSIFAQWSFQTFLRLFILCVTLYQTKGVRLFRRAFIIDN